VIGQDLPQKVNLSRSVSAERSTVFKFRCLNIEIKQLSIMKTIDQKQAVTQHDISPLIKKRWSPRSFSDQPIDQQDMEALFEAASWAASSYNAQPWQYLYAHRTDEAGFQRMLSCLNASNQVWAKDAAVLVLSVAQTQSPHNGRPNRHAWHDTGAANAHLLLEAARRDIYGHAIGGFEREQTAREFVIPASTEPVCFIALGYLGDPEQLEEPLRSRELSARSRQPVDAFTKKVQ
jgi:nitroreductase